MVAALGLVPAFALSHYQIGYHDGCAGRTVPGSHTADYERDTLNTYCSLRTR
jgi:hypothetical protein